MDDKAMKYKIEFFSNWHCGSGQSAGADVDALVVRDADGLPFVPGKTIKGLLREAVGQLLHFRGMDETPVEELFGTKAQQGRLFFGNITLSEKLVQRMRREKIDTEMLYRSFASTAIGKEDGIAEDHSLRRIETVIPCTLYGEITGFSSPEEEALMADAMKLVKRLGLGRNRGYGRCELSKIDV